MIKYYKLFDMLNRRDMNKSDLLEILSSKTIAKLSKGNNIQTEVIDKICEYLGCQPGDIMEYVETYKDRTTGKEVEIADHTYWEGDENRPLPDDVNIYPSDEDNPFEGGYKPRIM